MINGFVLAGKGEKISKSKGNAALAPARLIETHSADVPRYWTANARLGPDTYFAEKELASSKRFLTKLRNASRFAISRLDDIEPGASPELMPVDRWIPERVRETTVKAAALLEQYEIGQARHEIDALFWDDFRDHYIEIVKERLYQPEKHGTQGKRAAQYALYHALLGILKLYAVYVPYITEYLYQSFFRQYENTASIFCAGKSRVQSTQTCSHMEQN